MNGGADKSTFLEGQQGALRLHRKKVASLQHLQINFHLL